MCMCMEATYHTITTQLKAENAAFYLLVCCYGIDLSTSIIRLNQSEHSISRDLDQ